MYGGIAYLSPWVVKNADLVKQLSGAASHDRKCWIPIDMHSLQVMMGFIAEWEPKLGVKIVCSQVRTQPPAGCATCVSRTLVGKLHARHHYIRQHGRFLAHCKAI